MKSRPAQFHSLLHSANLLERRLTLLLEPFGIRPRQARILNVLNRMGPVSQKLLTEEFGITAGSMSTMVDRLLARELITRHRNPDDLRSDVLELTQTGRAMLQDIRGVWQDVDDMLEASLGEEKAQLLTDLARELRIALGGTVPGKGKGRDRNRDESDHQGREKSTKADPKADAGLRLTIKQDREDDRS